MHDPSGRFCRRGRNAIAGRGPSVSDRSCSRNRVGPFRLRLRERPFDPERVDLAPLVERPELAVDDGDLTVVLDPDLPVRRLGDAAETAPVDDEPPVLAGGPVPLTLSSPSGSSSEPVDVLGSEALGVVDVELAALLAPWLLPVDLLAPGLDDVQVEVGLGVPDQGELGIADLDLDAPDLSPPWPNRASPKPSPSPAPGCGSGSPRSAWRSAPSRVILGSSVGMSSGLRGPSRGRQSSDASAASGIASGVFSPPVMSAPPRRPAPSPPGGCRTAGSGVALGAKYQSARTSSSTACRTSEDGPTLEHLGRHPRSLDLLVTGDDRRGQTCLGSSGLARRGPRRGRTASRSRPRCAGGLPGRMQLTRAQERIGISARTTAVIARRRHGIRA